LLRSLRGNGETASAPHRPRQVKQCGIEHPDAVQVLPRLLAFDCAPDWAGSGWEDAVPRVANGIPDRAHRLKGLGNAVVPQIPELIGNAILAAINSRAGVTLPPAAVGCAPVAGPCDRAGAPLSDPFIHNGGITA
jgi:hypothetical protein